MADKCPMCDGPVKITGHESNVKEGYTIKLPTYRSTAAEQLTEYKQDLEVAGDETVRMMNVNAELRQQLVDKERELTVSKQWAEADKIELAKMDDLVTKLTAANAVIEHLEKFHYCEKVEHRLGNKACTVCATIARHKLQGGGGDE